MAHELEKPLLDLERRSPNYPLLLLGGFVFLCLGAIIVLSANLAAWAIFALSVFAAIGLAAVWYFSYLKPPEADEDLDWLPVAAGIQKQSLALEVDGIAAALGLDPWQTTELVSAYIVAEDLALRQIQQEQNAPIIRHAQLGKTPFDSLIIKHDEVICVEVAFLVVPELRDERIASMLRKAAALKRHFRAERKERAIKLLIVLVTQLDERDGAKLRASLGKERFDGTAVDIDIRLLDFEELQKRFLSEN